MATIITKNGKYYIQYWHLGKRKTVKTNLAATEDSYKLVVLMKNKISEKVEIKKSDLKYRDIMNSFGNHISEKEISIERAVDIYRHKLALTSKSYQERFSISLDYFYLIVPKETKINKVTFEHSLRFIKLLTERELSNASVRTYFEHIKMLFQFLVKNKYLNVSPLSNDELPRKTKKTIITFDEKTLNDIMSAAKEISIKTKDMSFYHILIFLLLTGLRPKDLLNVKLGDINFSERTIHVRISKTDKEMQLPLSKNLYNYIISNMNYIMNLDSEQYIFPNYTVSRLGKKFRRLKSKLGIKDKFVYTLKTFRKSFATHYASKLNIQDVALLLGHDNVSTTKGYYSKIKTENVRKEMDKLGDIIPIEKLTAEKLQKF